MKRLLSLLVAAVAAAVTVAACGGSSGGAGDQAPSPAGEPAAATITIKDFAFGAPVTVKPGATVKVVNEDGVGHDVVGDNNAGFETPELSQGDSATFTAPDKPGRYTFSCSLHPASMTGIGTLVVEG
jgi:plastocyanin